MPSRADFLSVHVAHAVIVQPTDTIVNPLLRVDLGYNEMNFMNSTRGLITPHLDALANTGVILKNYCEWKCMHERVRGTGTKSRSYVQFELHDCSPITVECVSNVNNETRVMAMEPAVHRSLTTAVVTYSHAGSTYPMFACGLQTCSPSAHPHGVP